MILHGHGIELQSHISKPVVIDLTKVIYHNCVLRLINSDWEFCHILQGDPLQLKETLTKWYKRHKNKKIVWDMIIDLSISHYSL